VPEVERIGDPADEDEWSEREQSGDTVGIRSIVGVALSVAIASASFFLVEQRFLRFKPRSLPRPTPQAARAYAG